MLLGSAKPATLIVIKGTSMLRLPTHNLKVKNLEQKEIEDLRKNYPEENYDIKEGEGRLTIAEKKAILWIPSNFLNRLPKTSKELSEYIEKMIEASFDKNYFCFEQKVVSKKCWQLIGRKAREFGTTRKMFLITILEKHFKE